MTAAPHPKLDELIAILARLRAPGGCAWDRDQTHASLVQYLVEETYELAEAIESGSREDLIEELGDVLYQVIFHSDIAAHTPGEEFTIEDVAAHMSQKMVGRHPHVFGDAVADTADDVMAIWDDLKATEKPQRTSVLDGIPQAMPALALADKLLGRAHKVGVAVPDAGRQADARREPAARARRSWAPRCWGSCPRRRPVGSTPSGPCATRSADCGPRSGRPRSPPPRPARSSSVDP